MQTRAVKKQTYILSLSLFLSLLPRWVTDVCVCVCVCVRYKQGEVGERIARSLNKKKYEKKQAVSRQGEVGERIAQSLAAKEDEELL
jgi:hypothetical protein